ncbi:MAG TPA: trypsin-like peptidase domain-containing protein [Acidothermaceae bacterium]
MSDTDPRHRTHRRPTTLLAGTAVVIAAAAGAGAGGVALSKLGRTAGATASSVAGTPVSTGASNGSGTSNASGTAGGSTSTGQPANWGWGYGGYGYSYGGSSGSTSSNSGSSATTEGSGGPSDVSTIAAGVDAGLVDINVTLGYQDAKGAATGIVLTSTGEILTNNHVVDGATAITVTDIGNGKTYRATVVGYDPTHDIAVLQLQGASGLNTAKLGDSSKVTVGEAVVAIGNAGGTGGTPSAAGGAVTALNQQITAGDELGGTSEQLTGLIEVNADIEAGDSGGSLVNSSGQVIGVDTAASSTNGTGQFAFDGSAISSDNQGFAVPINEALSIVKQITSGHGTTTVHVGSTAFLGVELASTDSSGYGYYGYGATVSGATVAGVLDGGTAAGAGLVAGDVITSLGGHAIDSASALSALMFSYHAGTSVKLGWTDSGGQSHTATVVLGSGPAT